MTYTDDDVTAAAEVALSYGAAPGSSLHSWRCEDKERYPESCTCVTEMAHEIVTTVAPAIAARALNDPATKALIRADAFSDALAVMNDSDDLDEAKERVTMLFRDAVGVRARAERVGDE